MCHVIIIYNTIVFYFNKSCCLINIDCNNERKVKKESR